MNKYKILPILSLLLTTIIMFSTASQAAVSLPSDLIPGNLPEEKKLENFMDVQSQAAKLISPLLEIAGGVSIFFIVLGGFMWITAMGKQEQLEKGKKILTWAIIGFIVIILSYAIVQAIVFTIFEEIPKSNAPGP